MALSVNTSGTQTATLTTEHSLATVTTAGVFVFAVDLTNLANGEEVTLRVKTKLFSGEASQLAFEATYKHAQQEVNKYSFAIPSPIEVVITLEQNGGTGRSFPWALYEA